MEDSSTLKKLEKKSSSLFMKEQQAKNQLSVDVKRQIARLPEYKQGEILSTFEHDFQNNNLPYFARKVKEAIATETDIIDRYDENDSPHLHILNHIKDYLLEQGFIHAQVREIQQELVLFLKNFYDASQKTTEKVTQMDENLKQLTQRVGSVEVLVSGFQAQLQGNEERIANQVRGSLTQDLQGIATLEGRVPQDLTTQLTGLQTGLATLEGRIPENFAQDLQNDIDKSVRANLPQNIVGQRTYWAGIVGALVTGVIILGFVINGLESKLEGKIDLYKSEMKSEFNKLNSNMNSKFNDLDSSINEQKSQTNTELLEIRKRLPQ